MTKRRVAVLGGTFDPIQNAHLQLAAAAQDALSADEVWFVPLSTPMHRTDPEASSDQRLTMAKLAVSNVDSWRVLDLELQREGPSYSIDSWRDLTSRFPDDEMWWVLGADAARGIRTWHAVDEVLGEMSFLVADRVGSPPLSEEELVALGFDMAHTRLVHAPIADVSATAVREAVGAHEAIAQLVPPAVAVYIEANHLYAGRVG